MAFGDKVQSKGGTTSVTFTSTPTSGNLLVFLAASTANVTFTAPTGFTGGTAVAQSGGSALGMQMAYKISAGTESGAISPASGTATYCVIVEYRGPFAASPLEVQNAQINTAGQTQASPNVSPTTGVTRLCVGGAMQDNTTQTWTEGTEGFPNTGAGALIEDHDEKGTLTHIVADPTGAVNFTGFSNSAIAGAAGIMVFIPRPRTTKNTRSFPLGTEIGMNWRGAA